MGDSLTFPCHVRVAPLNTPVDIYGDASFYDALYATLTKDIRFYHKLAVEKGAPVLELAVGTGRLALPIVQDGISLVGLDASASMLAGARRRMAPFRKHCRLVRGDYGRFRMPTKFALIYSGFNALHHAYRWRDFLSVLDCVRRHLKPDGVFAFDVLNPRHDLLKPGERIPQLHERFYDERTQEVCEIWETYEYDSLTQIKVCQWECRWTGGMKTHVKLKMRVYFPQEIEQMLDRAGFRILHRWGDFDESGFSPVSPKQIMICARSRIV